MDYIQSKINNKTLVFSILLILFFYIFLMPCLDKQINEENKILNEQFNDLVQIDKNICSKSCCKFTQWPVPFNTVNPNISPEILDKFIGSNLTCNHGSDGGGCVCLTKEDSNYLTNHGMDNLDK